MTDLDGTQQSASVANPELDGGAGFRDVPGLHGNVDRIARFDLLGFLCHASFSLSDVLAEDSDFAERINEQLFEEDASASLTIPMMRPSRCPNFVKTDSAATGERIPFVAT